VSEEERIVTVTDQLPCAQLFQAPCLMNFNPILKQLSKLKPASFYKYQSCHVSEVTLLKGVKHMPVCLHSPRNPKAGQKAGAGRRSQGRFSQE
jgi:hypothetical protein